MFATKEKRNILMQNSIYFDDASLRFHEIFHCFVVLCFDFEDVNSFFMGISRRAYYYMHQFFQARFYCFESLRVLGRREELTMWPRHKKIETSSQPLVNIAYCLSALLHDFIFSTKPVPIQKRSTWDIWTFFALPIQSCSSGLANTTFANYNSISNYQKANQRPC